MNHLEILRNEHVRLQTKYAELQRRYDILEANRVLQNANEFTGGEDSGFVKRLIDTVLHLYNKDIYRFQ